MSHALNRSEDVRLEGKVFVDGLVEERKGRREDRPRGYVSKSASGDSVWRVKYGGKMDL